MRNPCKNVLSGHEASERSFHENSSSNCSESNQNLAESQPDRSKRVSFVESGLCRADPRDDPSRTADTVTLQDIQRLLMSETSRIDDLTTAVSKMSYLLQVQNMNEKSVPSPSSERMQDDMNESTVEKINN